MSDHAFPAISLEGGSFDSLLAEAAAQGDPVASVEIMEELFRHDGTAIDLVRDAGGRTWLRADVGDVPTAAAADGPRRRVETVLNHLLFPDAEASKATLHDGFAPTLDSYRLCEALLVQVLSHEVGAGSPPSDPGYSCRPVVLEDVPDGQRPYAQLLPGDAMAFGPLADSSVLSREESDGLHRWPVPTDDVLAFHDCPRIWIGRFDPPILDPASGPLAHLVACVTDDGPVWVQHRLDFAEADEAAMRATLAAGQAPTMDTYRMAKAILRETVDHSDPAGATLLVEPIRADDLGERPAYDTVADHDREWPRFAANAREDDE